ncbi:ABC transporter substrate-binding protein [Sulfitobacter delicatus]|mgnify:FL=1|uniref:Iron complex transport system substrate-binding protein n=1 Tax=Sulfitobacter delicatus TaxID=218672 RepID=A0A1G7VGK6_9RHOB|nr:ABC transporter substrate-binding protein [Sulfitobacter delicatus]SDG58945.1 iron complex transport system substrate-binding protein [Sulfitobacter delicatus]
MLAAKAGITAIGLLAGTAQPALAQDVPRRVVSMNLCTDQLAMLLADKGQLISVSDLAHDPRSSAMVAEAAAYPVNNGLAEEIYLMQPDLVLAGRYSQLATVDMLRRLGIRVEQFDPATSLDQVTERMTRMGALLGREDIAADQITRFDQRLASFRDGIAPRPRAALYFANGYTSGDQTLAGDILTAAGLINIAAELGLVSGGVIPLETLAMAEPDTVVTGQPYPGASRSEEILSHPVVGALQAGRPSTSMNAQDWLCGTPYVLRAIGQMAELRRDVQADRERQQARK